MSLWRIFAIAVIFAGAWAGWLLLGTTTWLRSDDASTRLGQAVAELWGQPLVQPAPSFSVQIPGTTQQRPLLPVKNRVQVQLSLDYRQKGLVWYPTYLCDFKAEYLIHNPGHVAQKVRLHFPLPAQGATYDRFVVLFDGVAAPQSLHQREGVRELFELAPGAQRSFQVSYQTRGLREWHYRFDPQSNRVQDLQIQVQTNFTAVDFPPGSLAPMQKTAQAETGMRLEWQAADLITAQPIGVLMPERLNPGPLAARISFFAPVCLLFFYVLLTALGIVRRVNIHPMHYLFVAAGFFAFNLLFSYLVDHLALAWAFWLAAGVSVLLVTTYLAHALGSGLPWWWLALGQIFYLVLFSYSFFFVGVTGLIVTVGAILTLALLMALTARTDWNRVFGKTA